MSSLSPRIDRIERTAYGSEIEVGKIPAPFTTIKNEQGQPRQISDLANNMKVSMGVERVMFDKLTLSDKEFGPNGEAVYKTGDDRIRIVGADEFSPLFGGVNNGVGVAFTSGTTDFVEITFYGTGLNVMFGIIANNRFFDVIIDGVASGTVSCPTSTNNILGSRNYRANYLTSVVSGLSLGIHTVKLTIGNAGSLPLNGFEILNESTQLAINPGKPRYNSKTQEITAPTLTDYNTGFDTQSDTLGTKGGRVLVYQSADGSVNKRFKATDPQVTEGDPTELVTNGTFDTDLSGWSSRSISGSTITWNAGSLRLTSSATADEYAYQLIPMVAGQKYKITLDRTFVSGGNTFYVRTYQNDGVPGVDATLIENLVGPTTQQGSFELIYTAQFNGELLTFLIGSASTINDIDNVSVKEVSYNFLALTDTDHSQEEIIRRINFREFGANRSDDFSTLSSTSSDRAFTLDDGTTTLVGDDVVANTFGSATTEALFANSTGDSITITFIGTGIDFIQDGNTLGTSVLWDLIIDGQTIASSNEVFEPNALGKRVTIASGLPYGTHTVKLLRISGSSSMGISNFIIYGPKKPELAEDELELAEYNIMADYIANTTAGIETMSTGVLRKDSSREMVYSGTWIQETMIPTNNMSFQFYTNTNGGYFEYTFFGTGFDIRGRAFSSYATDATITIDGNSDLSAYTINGYGGFNIDDPSTGSIRQDLGDIKGSGVAVSGLPLGVHTVRVTQNGTDSLILETFDIITPIHINDSSFKVGSLAMKDLRQSADIADSNKNKIDWTKAKALLVYNQTNSKIEYSKNISSVLNNGTGNFRIFFKQPFKDKNHYIMTVGGNLSEIEASDSQREKNYVNVFGKTSGGTSTTTYWTTFAFFGELENEEDLDLGDL